MRWCVDVCNNPRMAKPRAKSKRARAPRGQVGQQTYEQVRKLVAEKKLPVGQAFAEVAKATGRKAGTVAVTYYRIARRQGAPVGRRGRKPGRPASSGRDTAGNLQGVLARVTAAVDELKRVVAHQEREIVRLQGESKLAERIRKAMLD